MSALLLDDALILKCVFTEVVSIYYILTILWKCGLGRIRHLALAL